MASNCWTTMAFGVITLVVAVWQVPLARSSDLSVNPLKQIQINFGDNNAITFDYENNIIEKLDETLTIEFCPENTCDGFEAPQGSPIDDLRNFSYLYLFYFSGYIYLNSWRQEEAPRQVARRILINPRYSDCRNHVEFEAAGCIMRTLARTNGMRLYFVRHDEGARHVVPMDVDSETTRSR